MKKVALISTYCNTEEKLSVLRKNLEILKNNRIDTIAISPILLPLDIINKCTHFIYTSENPVLDWPTKAISQWMILGKYKLHRTYGDYGWAGLNQVKRLGEFAINYDYDLFYHIIYDLHIDGNVEAELQRNDKNIIYPSTRGSNLWPFSLHLMVYDKASLRKFNSLITLESYLKHDRGDAFSWLEKVAAVIPCESTGIPVRDEIDYYENFDFFNYSPSSDFKLFFQKTDRLWKNGLETFKIMFYGFSDQKEIEIIINGISHSNRFNEYDIYDTQMLPDVVSELKLSYKDNLFNLTEAYNSIKINDIEKL
jgi:hypothetical protein